MNCKIWTQMAKAVFLSAVKLEFLREADSLLEGSENVSWAPCGVHPVSSPQLLSSPDSMLGTVGLPKRECQRITSKHSWNVNEKRGHGFEREQRGVDGKDCWEEREGVM